MHCPHSTMANMSKDKNVRRVHAAYAAFGNSARRKDCTHIIALVHSTNVDSVGWAPKTGILLRLLGMAYLSLALCYFFGLQSQQDKIYPSDTVWIGILSNGGAFAVLLNSGVRTTNWKEWGSLAKVFMWISLFATGMICSSLVIFGPLR